MAILSKDIFSKWKMLKPGAFTVGLETKTPVDHNTAMKGLSEIGKRFRDLTESRYDKEEDRFVLRSTESDSDKETLFRLTGYKSFEFAWGPLVELEVEPHLVELLNCIQDEFHIYPVNVALIDLKFYAVSEWPGHHYLAICQAFLNNAPLASLFEPKLILQDDLFLRGLLGEGRICVVRIESNVKDSEVLTETFKNDVLKVFVGIAQTKLPYDARLGNVFVEHSQVAINFIQEKFIPNVVEPLDKALIKLSVGKEQG